MKKAILMLFSLLCFTTYLGAQTWNGVLAPEIKASLNDLAMVSDTEIWAVGDDGIVIHTTDGFETIDTLTLGDGSDFDRVAFVGADSGWIGSEAGSVFYTTDGGTSWSEVSLSSAVPSGFSFAYFDGLYFVNDTLGFAIAGKYKNNYIFKTTDGGLTWAAKDSMVGASSSSERWYDISFYDENKGVAGGYGKGTLRYTTDGGETWVLGDSSVYSGMGGCAVKWINENEVIYVAMGNSYNLIPLPVYKSTDGGVTWTDYSDASVYDRATDVYFKDDDNGIMVGHNGFREMFYSITADGGETWTSHIGDYSLGLAAIAGDGDLLYALGTSGHILKSTDFGSTWEVMYFNDSSPIAAMQFTENKAYALNTYSDFLTSSNGTGNSWEIISSAGMWDAGALYFLDDETGFAVKENAGILKTTDGGNTWDYVLDPVDYSSYNKVGGISFADDDNGYALFSINSYYDYYLYKTTDGGDSWSVADTIDGPGYFSGGVEFFDANDGFIAAPHEKDTAGVYQPWLQYTTDGGITWTAADFSAVPDSLKGDSFDAVAKMDDSTAFAVGGISFFKTTDKGKTWSVVDFNATLNDTDYSCVAFNGSYGVVGTGDCEFLYTTDGGETWTLDQENYDQYTLKSLAVDEDGNYFFGTNDGYIFGYYDNTTDVKEGTALATGFELEQNYPNPFNPTTTIGFTIPETGNVKIKIYNVLGQEVKTLVNTEMTAGAHSITFDASHLASGVYIYSIKAGSYSAAKKMMLMK